MSSKSPDKRKWDTTIIVSLNNLKEINSQDFEHHDKVLAVGPVVDERVQELRTVTTFSGESNSIKSFRKIVVIFIEFIDGLFPFLSFPIVSNLIKDIDLIISGLGIMLGTLLAFDGDI